MGVTETHVMAGDCPTYSRAADRYLESTIESPAAGHSARRSIPCPKVPVAPTPAPRRHYHPASSTKRAESHPPRVLCPVPDPRCSESGQKRIGRHPRADASLPALRHGPARTSRLSPPTIRSRLLHVELHRASCQPICANVELDCTLSSHPPPAEATEMPQSCARAGQLTGNNPPPSKPTAAAPDGNRRFPAGD